ncbi:hypothetical protein CSUI_004716 [Cystoisospora suis]|uniref:Transmembrane protein n=1 Tax=Cystoisospora suis TaxID=483139 RepID=A0A2C6KAB5_9APIC|nr:hypothetical protein CSUI_004716 [Cystoisospora suis]
MKGYVVRAVAALTTAASLFAVSSLSSGRLCLCARSAASTANHDSLATENGEPGVVQVHENLEYQEAVSEQLRAIDLQRTGATNKKRWTRGKSRSPTSSTHHLNVLPRQALLTKRSGSTLTRLLLAAAWIAALVLILREARDVLCALRAATLKKAGSTPRSLSQSPRNGAGDCGLQVAASELNSENRSLTPSQSRSALRENAVPFLVTATSVLLFVVGIILYFTLPSAGETSASTLQLCLFAGLTMQLGYSIWIGLAPSNRQDRRLAEWIEGRGLLSMYLLFSFIFIGMYLIAYVGPLYGAGVAVVVACLAIVYVVAIYWMALRVQRKFFLKPKENVDRGTTSDGSVFIVSSIYF